MIIRGIGFSIRQWYCQRPEWATIAVPPGVGLGASRSTMTAEIPLLVVSCDRYCDLWPVFFAVFRRQWPDCPYPIYLGTNSKSCDEPGVRTLAIGSDNTWSDDLAAMLQMLSCRHVMLFLDDFFILNTVDTAFVRRLVGAAESNDVSSIRLSPLPEPTPLPPKALEYNEEIGVVPRGFPYRISTQAAIWRREDLLRLLAAAPGTNIWQWEHLATQMGDALEYEFWGPFAPAVNYLQVVEKGRWTPQGIEIARAANAHIDFARRGAFTAEELARHYATTSISPSQVSRQAAIYAFLDGNRAKGFSHVLSALRTDTLNPRLWAIAGFGLLGRSALTWLIGRNVQRRVRALNTARRS